MVPIGAELCVQCIQLLWISLSALGGTVSKLWGYAGIYGDVSNVDYIVLNDSTINIKNLNGQAAFALPVDYNNNDLLNDPLI